MVIDVPIHFSYFERNNFQFDFDTEPTFGGSACMKIKHFLKINGFSNYFFGHGGEDQEAIMRLYQYELLNKYTIFKILRSICLSNTYWLLIRYNSTFKLCVKCQLIL